MEISQDIMVDVNFAVAVIVYCVALVEPVADASPQVVDEVITDLDIVDELRCLLFTPGVWLCCPGDATCHLT